MGSCIICGTDVDGVVCASHEEDVFFRFTGNHPGQLTVGRFYEGTVDGFADFGVFVDIGERVTGLLHRSKLDKRLESLDWEAGETVFVQVKGVQDNGNVDLGWSIRQSPREFRGEGVQTPDGDHLPEETDEFEGNEAPGDTEADGSERATPAEPDEPVHGTGEPEESAAAPDEPTETADGGGGSVAVHRQEPRTGLEEVSRVEAASLESAVGERVRVEGRIEGVRQTSGPTVFTLRDETGSVECAAFVEAGVRAYPDVEEGDVVALVGDVERHQGSIQVETEALTPLDGEEASSVVSRLDGARDAAAAPESTTLLTDEDPVAAVGDTVVEAATAIRRAILDSRPIVVRHTATADGYVAGAAIERAVLPLVREHHEREDAQYHYFDRHPLDGESYGMDAATGDLTHMLTDRERHDEKLPLVVLVAAGGTRESADGIGLLDVYGVDRLVIDAGRIDDAVAERVETVLTGEGVTTTALAANVAAVVDDGARGDLAHLPAVSYWESVPEVYAELAAEAGYDEGGLRELREAVALEAYYQAYEDKRELISDLLFGDDDGVRGLASHVSEQFRVKLESELETARPNVEVHDREGLHVASLDTDAYTHRFDFPPTSLLLDALFRELRDEEPFVLLGLDESELRIRSTEELDVGALAERVEERVPDAGLAVRGTRHGRLEFLIGRRDAVHEATLSAISEVIQVQRA
ncbi:OB-fold nucleic acid binding domain-containing protein [Natronorarus salvus]|uniref:OB-fold nucleic acid binding domain-containing protein n=1 Tax=Natronorarus salvus TaxID=3117733 RepID=UPI002F2656C2